MLRPFFSFYGAKWRLAKRYPRPTEQTLIEPFAGSAGYALRYPDLDVRLIDADPVIAGVWDYVIHAPESEVRALPLDVGRPQDLRVPKEAQDLIGFWLNKGSVAPARQSSAWMRSGTWPTQFWGEAIRERIASQQASVRHWTINYASYESAPDIVATWFIDPPYSTPAGRHYRVNGIDYEALARWSIERRGQVMVCEQEGATWLPFRPFHNAKANVASGHSREAIWP